MINHGKGFHLERCDERVKPFFYCALKRQKLSALREVSLAREIHELGLHEMQSLYMGSCLALISYEG